ncbi:GspH/FimT family pseudopilin [Alteromonas sp. C1M14]|uniref:GspH/FimT family pseudopilin n=1 Tax=Alteromonas sp. C1M14 TaxID=2841567 RepID=UPI001C0A424F|nr:GspH/FimT family pseudopilin [Alteromonas sp. C1M14]MBU2979094.1 GspH/FimT family pseudopilin [Alteromonas sp. C1M14]
MKNNKGLSLIELMITVAIAAILLTVGAPGIQSILQQNRVIAATNDISSVIRTARFTAIDQEQLTILCPTSDYDACGTDWTLAKMVFIDANSNGSRDANETLIQSTDPLGSGLEIAGIKTALSFSPDGSVSTAATITLCPASGDATAASAVIVSLYGRVAVAKDSNNNGIKEDSSGSDLSCGS